VGKTALKSKLKDA